MEKWKPQNALASAVYAAGFEYDPGQNIIYSRMDALQRNLGYAYGYDKNALLMSAAIDCEPIFFDFGGKIWMIELWKGQYILETGCEIGVYNRDPNDHSATYNVLDELIGDREKDSNSKHNLFYNCVNDSEMLLMSFTLYRNGEKLFSRGPEKHWWLTGFKWGVYSKPSQLTMDINISFEQTDMQNAFIQALRDMGYKVSVSSNNVSFVFSQPTTYQPRLNNPSLSKVNISNQEIVNKYNSFKFSNNDPNQIHESAWGIIEPGMLIIGNFFNQILANIIISLEQWVETMLGLIGAVFAIDDSCTVEFDNQSTDIVMIRMDYNTDYGTFIALPPAILTPGNVGRLYIKDPKILIGAEGWVNYKLIDTKGNSQIIKFSFGCPEFEDNHIAISPIDSKISFKAKSGGDNWGPIDQVPTRGHPLFVKFIINQGSTNEVTIVDHLTGGTDIGGPQLIGNYPGTGIIELASGFDVTGNSFNLTKIVLDVEYPSNDNTILNVVLCSDLNGLPGSEIEVMSIIVPNHSSNSEVLSNNKPLLENGKRYWIKLSIKDKSLKATWDRAGNISGINAYKIDDKPFQSGGYTSPPVDVFAYRMAVIGCPIS